MKYKCLVTVLVFFSFSCVAQFKNDNVLYTTVDPSELCAVLQKNKGYLLLDVRSKGEHYDTSATPVYNLGHFKGARNIDINDLGKRLNEISDFKNKPVFVYCSHSQRSRRAGKMLADSGFTKVFNINGGMTAFHYKSLKDEDCVDELYKTSNRYNIISFNQLCDRMQKDEPPYLVDVRNDSAFRHISKDPKANALGVIKGSVNIPFSDFEDKMGDIPKKTKEIVIIDMFGGDAAKAAVLLKQKGYGNVSILIEGIDRILSTDSKDLSCRDDLYISPVSFTTFNATEFGRYAKQNPDFTLLDIRTAEEFGNKYKDSWRNIGHLVNAVNIPVDKLETRIGDLDKNKETVVYGYSSGSEVYRAAFLLQQSGFTNVKVLVGGIFNMRWSSGNIHGQDYLADMVVDVPEINQ